MKENIQLKQDAKVALSKHQENFNSQEENAKLKLVLNETYDMLEKLSIKVKYTKTKPSEIKSENEKLYQAIENIKKKLHRNANAKGSYDMSKNEHGNQIENEKLKEDISKLQSENNKLKVALYYYL